MKMGSLLKNYYDFQDDNSRALSQARGASECGTHETVQVTHSWSQPGGRKEVGMTMWEQTETRVNFMKYKFLSSQKEER